MNDEDAFAVGYDKERESLLMRDVKGKREKRKKERFSGIESRRNEIYRWMLPKQQVGEERKTLSRHASRPRLRASAINDAELDGGRR